MAFIGLVPDGVGLSFLDERHAYLSSSQDPSTLADISGVIDLGERVGDLPLAGTRSSKASPALPPGCRAIELLWIEDDEVI